MRVGPFVYNGAAQTPCTVTVTGPGALSLTPTATYVNNVNAGTATASYNYPGDANYEASSDPETFTIDPKPATWTTNPSGKIYGNSDPVPLTTGSGTGFVPADGVTATYGRAAGDTVALSPYHITAMLSVTGSLSNYAITNVGANFTINPKPLTIAANSFNKLLGATYTFLGSEFGTGCDGCGGQRYERHAGQRGRGRWRDGGGPGAELRDCPEPGGRYRVEQLRHQLRRREADRRLRARPACVSARLGTKCCNRSTSTAPAWSRRARPSR